MRGIFSRLSIAALAVLMSWLFPGPSAQARELLRERFDHVRPDILVDNSVTAKDGVRRGFSLKKQAKPFSDNSMIYLDLPVTFDNTTVRGAISFDIQRKPGNEKTRRRTIFELLDANGRQILAFQIQWKSDFDPRLPSMFIAGDDYWINGSGLWSQQLLLDREVPPGQWIHADIAWDDGAKKYVLYVDGRAQNVTPRFYNMKNHKVMPDPRLDNTARRVLAKGSPPSIRSRPFGYFLSKTRTLRVGVNSHPPRQHVAASFLSQSVLDDFVVLAGEWPKGIGGDSRILSVSDDSFRVPGISGKLVAGDRLNVTLVASPGGAASFDVGGVPGIPMEAVPPTAGGAGIPAVDNGTYRGSYVIRPGDDFTEGRIVGRFVSADNVAAEPLSSDSRWTIDTKPRVAFSIDKKDLPADSRTKARIKLSARDANGKPLVGRHFRMTLATTDEYTGLVGAGDFGESLDPSVEARWKGETDSWGEVEFDYKAGFAAKTAILTAKDLDSGGVAVDCITSYKEASIDIVLTAPQRLAAARRGLAYSIKVEATRTSLTADGRSRSVIRATVQDPNGKPVAGDNVVFSLSSANGTLNTIKGTTDASGVATAEYIAGKKIGIVVVTATDTVRNISGSVSITLLADAPAKILLRARPETLPSDGNSRSDITVKVTDINDNPNKDTKVEFRLSRGSGRIDSPDRITDLAGDALNRFTAGSVPGVATIVTTVRSRVPSDAEMSRAQNVLFAPYNPAGEELKIARWLKKVGDTALFREPVLEYTVGRNSTQVYTLIAPFDCRIDFQSVEYWDEARAGDTLALVTPLSALSGTGTVPAALPKNLKAPKRRR